MKYYVQFTHEKDGRMVDNLGSDGVFILDGRNTLWTMKCDAMLRIHQLRKVSRIDGYKIIKARRFTGKGQLIYEWVRSGTKGGDER